MRKIESKPDYILLATTIGLIVMGLLILYSASVAVSYDRFGASTVYIQDQMIAAAIAVVAMFLIMRIPHRLLLKIAGLIFLGATILLLLVYVPGLGVKIGGARRWIALGGQLFQPSEFAKLALVLYLASFFSRRKELVESFRRFVLPASFACFVFFFLVALQPDIGTLIVFFIIAISIFFTAGIRLRHFVLLVGSGIALVVAFIASAPYRINRILAFLQPGIDPRGISYQLYQAILAIGSGGVFGYGYGYSRQKYQYLPEVIGDSIFAVAAEELGFIRIIVWLAIFGLFAYRGFLIAKHSPDMASRLVAVGVTAWVTGQMLVNVGAISGLLPLTGIPLPFTSFGGSALLSMCLGAGILLNISRERV